MNCSLSKFPLFRGALAGLALLISISGCAQNTADNRVDSVVAETSVRPKKVSILGDSYSTFEGWLTAPGSIAWYKPVPKPGRPTDVIDVNQTWWKIFIDEHGYQLEKNNSYSGSTVCNTGYEGHDYSDRSFVTRLEDLGDPDMILVFGGTNDAWAKSPLGEYVYEDWTPAQLYRYRPATAYMMSELKRRHPDAEIVCLINDLQSPQVTESTIEICRHYGIPYVELRDIKKMSDHPSAEGMRQIVFQLDAALGEKGR